jgi:hypothetical protein
MTIREREGEREEGRGKEGCEATMATQTLESTSNPLMLPWLWHEQV